jgi:squalene-associated FAD-dependent desaturase
LTRPHVVVVGGGLAGMAAALRCADAGARVVLLERRNRIGGATWSFDRDGFRFDNGQHVFLRCCTAYREFLGRIGATHLVRLQDRLDIPVVAPGGRLARLRRSPLPAPLHLGPALLRYRHLPVADRLSLVRAVLPLRRVDPDDPRADETSFGDWLAQHGQGALAVERLWDLITVPTVNLPAAEASLAQAAMVFRTGLLTDPTAADIGWSDVPLDELHAGRGGAALARAAVDVRTGVAVDAVVAAEPRSGQGPGVALEGGGRLAADAVIVAVPHQHAAGLLPPGSLPAGVDPEALGTSAIVDVQVVFDRPVLPHDFAAAVGSPIQWLFDRTQAAGVGEGGQCVALSISAADELLGARPDALVARFVDHLGDLFPVARNAQLRAGVVTKERAATPRFSPGTRRSRPGATTASPGVWLAGAWTDTGWPATMEGAVRSGWSAAEGALAATALPVPDHAPQEVVA